MRVLVACEYSGRVRDAFMDAREIDGYPGYLVTSDGEVLTCKTNFGMRDYYRKMKPSTDAKGYLGLTICGRSGERRKVRVHRLVAECFLPNPDKKPCVRHLDGNARNNNLGNLAWGTYAENEKDKVAHGTWDTRRNGKLCERDREDIREMSMEGWSQKALADLFDVSRPSITRLLNGATWQ